MQKIQKRISIVAVAVLMQIAILGFLSVGVQAATCYGSDGKPYETSIIDCSTAGDTGKGLIWEVLTIAVNFLAAGVGIAVVAGIVFGAVTYATAAGNADQAKKGISFVTNAVIALLLFIFMYAIINFLVPGGLF